MSPMIAEFANNPSLFIGMTAAEASAILKLMDASFPVEPAPRRLNFSRIPEGNNAEELILARQERIGGPVFDI